MRTPSDHRVYGIAAEYPSAAELYGRRKRVRDAGFKRWDVHSPFPIHGMDDAMGLGKSWLSAAGPDRRYHRFIHRGHSRVRSRPGMMYPLIVHGKPNNWRNGAGVFPDHV